MNSKLARLAATTILAASLAACGGGGGGNDTGSGAAPGTGVVDPNAKAALTTDDAALNGDAISGVTPALSLNGKIVNSSSHAIRLEELDNNQLFGATRFSVKSDGTFSATLPLQTVPAGDYSGSVRLHLCAVEDCSQDVTGVSATLPYTVHVAPSVPANGVSVLSSATQSLSFEFLPATAGSLEFDVSSGITLPTEAWLQVFSTAPTVAGRITLAADRRTSHVSVQIPADLGSLNPLQGKLNIAVCLDGGCTRHYGPDLEIPWRATAHPTLSALRPLAGTPDWDNTNGNAQHTGYVPVTLDPAAFSTRWLWQNDIGGNVTDSGVVTGNGAVYLRYNQYLVALSEERGATLWSVTDDKTMTGVSAAAYQNGRLFYTRSQLIGAIAQVRALDSATGQPVWQTQDSGDTDSDAPVVDGSGLYANVGSFTRPYNLQTGAAGFTWGGNEAWGNVAADAQNVYIWGDYAPPGIANNARDNVGILNIANKNSAATPRSYAIHNLTAAASTQGIPPVVGSLQEVLMATSAPADGVNYRSNDLLSINTQTGNVNWRHLCRCTGAPAVAQGLVYLADGERGTLDVLDEATGTLVWSAPIGSAVGSPLVTNNLVFVSSKTTTYAFDLQSHQQVWSALYAGKLSMSANGILYIYKPTWTDSTLQNGARATLAAFNLH
ncbi:outer membrane protein assembly factor BamB family protein [Amantichitinum ursilacus]|uniref:Outer membrane biogenesis protein BamB n=1 Tax=Amantichitinum ursilacus TaxID=857265 RepID=A0A0N0XIZ3_9NEIS|nr:PQQ-binding-like beta-propeller repeat protein [Amantichitinum ursilacus]KPC52871.1 outer membrane biogenesis protein BamB [Amantichitinum ursilacus]